MASKKTMRGLITFFLHMAQMEKAGVPLMQSLDAVAQDADDRALAKKWRNMAAFVRGGATLSEAMALYPRLFDEALRGLVAAGEESGRLAVVLERCQAYCQQLDAHMRRMRRATLQPKITAVVIAAMAAVRRHTFLPKLAAAVLGGDAGVLLARRYVPGVRRLTDKMMLELHGPLGTFTRQHAYARFTDALALVYAAGIPLRRGLVIAAGTVPNRVIRDDIEAAIPRVVAGEALYRAFAQCRYADGMAIAMLKTGEDSGNLAATLSHVAEYYNKETDEALAAVQQTMGPALVIVLGLMLYKSL